ncbi:MAG TPA: SDR family oxidoreductase [Acidimicrobiia bacterium]|nr:SDR family oxidoreductase [Acidimicrobiia bacterium]
MRARLEGAAVVTGAAGGIGLAICRRLAASGATVVAVDVADRLGATVADLESSGAAVIGVQADLTTAGGLDAVLGSLDRTGVALRTIVNNAGITRDARLVNMTAEDFRVVLEVNLGVAQRLIELLLPRLEHGTIVNISSRAYLGNFGQFNYSMSKGALLGLTRALALALAPAVRVNAVAPGLIGTEMSMAIPEDVRAKMVAAIPLGRMGQPEEVAETVAFLASEDSAYITGEVITVGGGRSLSR